MNSLGLQMFHNGYKDQCLELPRLNTVLFPDSGNACDAVTATPRFWPHPAKHCKRSDD